MRDMLFHLTSLGGNADRFQAERRQLGDAGNLMRRTGVNPVIDGWESSYASITNALYGMTQFAPQIFPNYDKEGFAREWLINELARSAEFLDYLDRLEKANQVKHL